MKRKRGTDMSIKIEIIKANLRHHFLMPFLAAVGILFLTAVLFPITALKGKDVSKPLEYFLPFVGVALLTPIFLPEQDSSIRDVVASKKINGSAIYKLRVLYSIAALLMLISIFVGIMYLNECEVRWYHFYGGFSSALFLGSIGFVTAGVSGNTVAGYMAAFLYYIMCYGLKRQLGVFWLFRMSMGLPPGKTWLLLGGFVLIFLAFAKVKGCGKMMIDSIMKRY